MWPDVTDELNKLDSAFAGNLLLATFSPEDRGLVEPSGESSSWQSARELSVGARTSNGTYFPFGTTMVSLVVELRDGRSVQVA